MNISINNNIFYLLLTLTYVTKFARFGKQMNLKVFLLYIYKKKSLHTQINRENNLKTMAVLFIKTVLSFSKLIKNKNCTVFFLFNFKKAEFFIFFICEKM